MKRLIVCILIFACYLCSSEDERLNTLPIGPSEFKHDQVAIEADQIMETSSQKRVSISDIIEKNKNTDIFIIGEFHNSYECHTFQRDFIEALLKKYPHVVVGFEFFNRKNNDILKQWQTGQLTENELIKKTAWYKSKSLNYGYTKPIMDVIRRYRIKTIGLNIPRKIVHKVSTRGFSTLSADEKKLFPGIQKINPEHKYYIKSIFGKPAVQNEKWFQNIYNAQKCWDIVMAESMRTVLKQKSFRKYKGVIIAGSAHVTYKLGIPFRYHQIHKRAKITTLIPVYYSPEKEKDKSHPMMKKLKKSKKPVALFSRGIGDYVFSVPKLEYEHFPTMGFQVRTDKSGNILIMRVKEGSIAEKNGLKKGDILLSIDGIKIDSKEKLNLLFSKKKWKDSLTFRVKKSVTLEKQTDTNKK